MWNSNRDDPDIWNVYTRIFSHRSSTDIGANDDTDYHATYVDYPYVVAV